MMKMIDYICAAAVEYVDHMPKSQGRNMGSFFKQKQFSEFLA